MLIIQQKKKLKRIIKYKGKYRAAIDSDKQQTKRKPCKCFRCGYEYHQITKCPKPPKDHEKQQKKLCFSERGNCASQK